MVQIIDRIRAPFAADPRRPGSSDDSVATAFRAALAHAAPTPGPTPPADPLPRERPLPAPSPSPGPAPAQPGASAEEQALDSRIRAKLAGDPVALQAYERLWRISIFQDMQPEAAGQRIEILRQTLAAPARVSTGPAVDPQRLAGQHAPVLVLPQGEYNLPADPQAFIANSRWRQDRAFWPDREHGNNTNGDRDDDFTASDVAGAGSDDFLDLDNDARGRLGSADAPVFYQYDDTDGLPRLTYHVFYAYNDGPSVQNHEGDWERITIELNPVTLEPMAARYSAHGHSSVTAFHDLPKDARTGRPLVYVAGGSHANYASPGGHPTAVPFFHDHTATDRNGDGTIDAADGALRFDTGRTLRDVRAQDWYPSDGKGLRWGEIGELDATSGPHGPSPEKGAVG
ncbi:hypothetical protein [Inquilinus sp. Marseille-Q2685]|uniref:hypothetical protein n=1 Tax=Inquilinus sp. Marseille-Q2685 TaxID=2866581 RepID=UPI001CE3E181|nr:hypothetical protein [Inquilinus sp. Marseille-Q2685]